MQFPTFVLFVSFENWFVCHSEAQPKNLLFPNRTKSRCFALAQHDTHEPFSLAALLLHGKTLLQAAAGSRSIMSVYFPAAAALSHLAR